MVSNRVNSTLIFRTILVLSILTLLCLSNLNAIGHDSFDMHPFSTVSSSEIGNLSYVSSTYLISTGKTYSGFHELSTSELDSFTGSASFSNSQGILYAVSGRTNISETNVSTWTTVRTISPDVSSLEKTANLYLARMTGLVYDSQIDQLFAVYQFIYLSKSTTESNSYLCAIDPVNGSLLNSVELGDFSVAPVFDQSNGMVYTISTSFGNSSPASFSNVREIDPINLTVMDMCRINGSMFSGNFVVNPMAEQLYIPDMQDDALIVLAADNLTNIANLSIGGFPSDPESVTFSSSTIYVFCFGGNISIINESTLKLETQISMCPSWIASIGITYDEMTSSVYVAGLFGTIYVLNLSSGNSYEFTIGEYATDFFFDNASHNLMIYGRQVPAIALVKNAPGHEVNFRTAGLPSTVQFEITVNGIQYFSNNGTISVLTAANTTNFSVYWPGAYMGFPWSGSHHTSGTTVITIYFVNFFYVLGPVLVVLGYFGYRKLRKYLQENRS